MAKNKLDEKKMYKLSIEIQHNINVNENFTTIVTECEHLIVWFIRNYWSIIQQYNLDKDDVRQEMYIGLTKAVYNTPLKCYNWYDWVMVHLRGSCLNFFKHNTNRLNPYSESKNKEKKFEETSTCSLNIKVSENDELADLKLIDEFTNFEDIIDDDYHKFCIKKIKEYLLNKFDNINIDLYFDFYKKPIFKLQQEYNLPMLNIIRYVEIINLILKSDKNFYNFCYKYIPEILIERNFKQYEFTNFKNKIYDLDNILNSEIITYYTGSTKTNFKVGVDVKIHTYFRVDFLKEMCI